MTNMPPIEKLREKWKPLLEHEDLPKIPNLYKRNLTAILLENTHQALVGAQREASGQSYLTETDYFMPIPANFMGASSSTPGAGGIDTFDPVLISLVRRTVPNLMAYDVAGVQPMTGPSGLIFCLRPTYSTQGGSESWYNEVNSAFSTRVGGTNAIGDHFVGYLPGNSTVSSNLADTDLYNYAGAMSTAQGEALGTQGNVGWPEMAFTIDRNTVNAKSRALKAEYTMEIAQDLRAVHGLDVEAELANILTTEILAEINREVIRTILVTAKQGCVEGTTNNGFFDLDLDSNGRWLLEKFKGLLFQVEKEANRIAKETRRGKGNLIICSADVASAFMMTGMLDYTPALADNSNLQVDDTGNTFAGILMKRYKVYIDPYADAVLNSTPGLNYMVVGFKGQNAYDAGLFYCPYVPLQMVRAVEPGSFHPKIGFKTRYGMVSNPFAQGGTTTNQGALLKDSNVFYRRAIIKNII